MPLGLEVGAAGSRTHGVPAPFDRAYKAPAFRKRYRSTKLTLTTAHVRGSARINAVGLRVIARCTVRQCVGDSELGVYHHRYPQTHNSLDLIQGCLVRWVCQLTALPEFRSFLQA